MAPRKYIRKPHDGVCLGAVVCVRARKVDVCLIKALRELGHVVLDMGPGPFWALADGNAFLSHTGKGLKRDDDPVLAGGPVLVHSGVHFHAEEIPSEGRERRPVASRINAAIVSHAIE
jgi:hypothetical protein